MSDLPFRDDLVAVFNADSAVQAVTGRTTLNLVPRRAKILPGTLPVMTFFLVVSTPTGGEAGHRRYQVQFEAWAEESDPNLFANLEILMDRAEVLFVGPVLQPQGSDVFRVRTNQREEVPEMDGVRSIRSDFVFLS